MEMIKKEFNIMTCETSVAAGRKINSNASKRSHSDEANRANRFRDSQSKRLPMPWKSKTGLEPGGNLRVQQKLRTCLTLCEECRDSSYFVHTKTRWPGCKPFQRFQNVHVHSKMSHVRKMAKLRWSFLKVRQRWRMESAISWSLLFSTLL